MELKMKKLLITLFATIAIASFALPPKSITLESGKVRVRLDSLKRWNINKIEWQNRLFGIDNPGAHYGIAYQPQGSQYFIGSGHDESGVGEKFISLKIKVDNKEVTPVDNVVIKGKKIEVEKISQITDLNVKYYFCIENDILDEKVEMTASKNVKIKFLYFFMHPWSTRFDKFHALFDNGKTIDITFNSKGSFPNREFVPSAAWHDSKSGLGVATVIKNVKGKKNPMRFLWDRSNYRKDYICDYAHSTFTTNIQVIYKSRTGFFMQQDNKKWVNDAQSLFKKLNKNF
jgi:hypothetical protein